MKSDKQLFEGLCITTTGLKIHIKEQVRRVVVACGGRFDDDLTSETTHLVADSVGSKKFKVANQLHLEIVCSRWIFDCFRQETMLPFDDYRLRVLEGLVICTTGLSEIWRRQVAKIATSHGAIYEADLEVDRTTILIAQQPRGKKYEAALLYQIPIVNINWLHECVEVNQYLDEAAFPVKKQSIGSSRLVTTQEKEIQETLASITLPSSQLSASQSTSQVQNANDNRPDGLDNDHDHATSANEEIQPKEIEQGKADEKGEEEEEFSFLFEGCVFYLLGFVTASTSSTLQNQLVQLIRFGMGTRLVEFHPRLVTHVIVGPRAKAQEIQAIERQVDGAFLPFVTTRWLLDSFKSKRLEPEALYPVEMDQLEAAAALEEEVESDHDSTNHHGIMGDDDPQEPCYPSQSQRDYLEGDEEKAANWMSSQDDVASFSGDRENWLSQEVDYSMSQPIGDVTTPQDDQPDPAMRTTSVTTQMSASDCTFARAMKKCHFLLICVDPQSRLVRDLIHRVEKYGSSANALCWRDLDVVQMEEFDFVTHMVVCNGVPFPPQTQVALQKRFEYATATASSTTSKTSKKLKFVTDLWLICCLHEKVLLARGCHELFTGVLPKLPIVAGSSRRPRVVLSISVYVGIDRLVLHQLGRLAGAKVTEKMNRHNTHLICLRPLGMRYEQAKKWHLHVVNARWLLQSIQQSQWADESLDAFRVRTEQEEQEMHSSTIPPQTTRQVAADKCISFIREERRGN